MAPAQPHDTFARSLTTADDRVRLSDWLPPQTGVIPRIRIGQRWISILWLLPMAFVRAVCAVTFAQGLREVPDVQEFLRRYPGVSQANGNATGASRAGAA